MAQIVNLTPRAFLASLNPPLAKSGEGVRGRFSKEAVAALDKARSEGFVFIGDAGHPETVVKAPKAPKAPKPTVTTTAPAQVKQAQAPTGAGEAKAIRAWAQKQDGLKVGDRGRLHADVVAAYRAAHGNAPASTVRVSRPTPADMPKVRPQTQAWAVIQPKKGQGAWAKPFVLGVEKCGKGHRIQSCTCETPSTNAEWGNTPLSLTKPVL